MSTDLQGVDLHVGHLLLDHDRKNVGQLAHRASTLDLATQQEVRMAGEEELDKDGRRILQLAGGPLR